MDRAAYLEFHSKCLQQMTEIMEVKSADYARESNVFSNFELCSTLNICSTEQGLLTRICDKLSRISNLVSTGNAQVKEESVEDALLDMANYCISLAGVLHEKGNRKCTELTSYTELSSRS